VLLSLCCWSLVVDHWLIKKKLFIPSTPPPPKFNTDIELLWRIERRRRRRFGCRRRGTERCHQQQQ
jgi:hypothetical protein